ncbi:hypothetical protein [Acinetobacter variabilis]|nr:hypothetical protein [Acinetobacter variabilis]
MESGVKNVLMLENLKLNKQTGFKLKLNTYYFHGLERGVTMKKHYPELEKVSDVLECIPHSQSQAVAKAIRVCNDIETDNVSKVCAVLKVIL